MKNQSWDANRRYVCLDRRVGNKLYDFYNHHLTEREERAFEEHLFLCFRCQDEIHLRACHRRSGGFDQTDNCASVFSRARFHHTASLTSVTCNCPPRASPYRGIVIVKNAAYKAVSSKVFYNEILKPLIPYLILIGSSSVRPG